MNEARGFNFTSNIKIKFGFYINIVKYFGVFLRYFRWIVQFQLIIFKQEGVYTMNQRISEEMNNCTKDVFQDIS